MFLVNVAWRFLSKSKMQSILITIGISVGVAVIIFLSSLISGLQLDLIDKTIGSSSQITISSSSNKYISDYKNIYNQLDDRSLDIKNLSYTLNGSGAIADDSDVYPIVIKGVDFTKSDKLYKLSDSIVSGAIPDTSSGIIIGKDLAASLNKKVGDKIVLTIVNEGNFEAVISAINDFSVSSLNETLIYTKLGFAQQIFNTGNVINQLEMQTDKIFDARQTADQILSIIGDSYKADTWLESNGELLSGLQAQSMSSILIQLFVIVSVVLGITSVLAISVIGKSRQLGILKAMGLTDFKTMLVFIFEGLILGLIGALIGMLLGYGLSVSFTKFAVGDDGSPVVNMLIDAKTYLTGFGVAVFSALIASIIPARRSAKLSVIEVIKNG